MTNLTIILPTLNCIEDLTEFFESIAMASKDLPDDQIARLCIYAIDGGSNDGTWDLLLEQAIAARYQLITEQVVGSSIYEAWNYAIDALIESEASPQSNWLCFLGADDRMLDLEHLLHDIASADKITDMLIYDYAKSLRSGQPFTRKSLRRGQFFWHAGGLHRLSIYKRFGKYSTSYRICSDYDFFCRTLDNISVAVHKTSPIHIRPGGASYSYKVVRETLRIKYDNFSLIELRLVLPLVDALRTIGAIARYRRSDT